MPHLVYMQTHSWHLTVPVLHPVVRYAETTAAFLNPQRKISDSTVKEVNLLRYSRFTVCNASNIHYVVNSDTKELGKCKYDALRKNTREKCAE